MLQFRRNGELLLRPTNISQDRKAAPRPNQAHRHEDVTQIEWDGTPERRANLIYLRHVGLPEIVRCVVRRDGRGAGISGKCRPRRGAATSSDAEVARRS